MNGVRVVCMCGKRLLVDIDILEQLLKGELGVECPGCCAPLLSSVPISRSAQVGVGGFGVMMHSSVKQFLEVC